MSTVESPQPRDLNDRIREFWESPIAQRVYDPVMVALEIGHCASGALVQIPPIELADRTSDMSQL